METSIHLGVVEDDVHIRELLRDYFTDQPGFYWVVDCGSVEEFLDRLPTIDRLDVLIQDIGLPGISGLEAIRLVKQQMPETEILMFSIYDDSTRIFQALCAGASGYLLKETALDQIKRSVADVDAGNAAMSPSIAKKVVAYFRPTQKTGRLTDKENQVVQLLTEGLSYKMIADRLQISMSTVQSHIKNIYRKLRVHSKAEVISLKLKGDI